MLNIESKKKYTADDYMMLEEGAPFQLINYDLITSPSPNSLHQVISIRLSQLILNFLDSINDEGFLVCAPMDVKLDEGNVFQPDLLYITKERKENIVKDIVEGAPDMVIEILSPWNAYYDLRQKKNVYEKYGVKEYIIIDIIALVGELFTLTEGIYNLDQKAQKNEHLKSRLLPGLNIDLSKLFR